MASDVWKYEMPFGKHKGKTLNRIADADRGLLYLDWCAGEFDSGPVLDAIKEFLALPGIEGRLQRLVNAKGRGDFDFEEFKL